MSFVHRVKEHVQRRWGRRRRRSTTTGSTSITIADDIETSQDPIDETIASCNNLQGDTNINAATGATVKNRRAKRPPSPYPPSHQSSPHYYSHQTRLHTTIADQTPSSSAAIPPLPSLHGADNTSPSGRPHSEAHLDVSFKEKKSPGRPQWLKRAFRRCTWLRDISVAFRKCKDADKHDDSDDDSDDDDDDNYSRGSISSSGGGINNKTRLRKLKDRLTRRRRKVQRNVRDSNSDEQPMGLDDDEIQALDLRHFYDPSAEDPANRVMFIAGPEHYYHLALQLETSPQIDYQLYGKDLFLRSAGLGYAPAQFKLGICYELGLTHFPMDPAHSFAWYKRAAMQGHADAELAVSGWYLTGHPLGLVQSEPLAYEWASKAARRGWSKAEYTLGHYHEVGIGVPQDLVVAKQWYIKAAAQGNERALLRLLVGHVGLQVDYAHLKDALLNENQNNPYMIHQLAQFHELREYGLVPDEDAAFELYAASAQTNYAPAQYKLGACYEFGLLGCPQDPTQAVHWYSQGAENGHVEALLALAGFYLDGSAGRAAEQSDEEAFRFVKAAAQRGVSKAEYITGFFLEYGLGVEKDLREAKQWYRLACAKGVDSAERRLRDLENVTATTPTAEDHSKRK